MKTLVAALAIAGSLLAAQAHAANYTFDFSGGGETFAGTLTTSTTGNSQLISSLVGTLNGAAVSLDPVGYGSYVPTNDNLVYPNKTGTDLNNGYGGGYLDGGGISFSSGGSHYNLYYYDETASNSYELDNNSSSTSFYTGTFTLAPASTTVSAAPEPGAWALMLGGVGILGGMLRVMQARRREDEVKDIATA